MKPARKTSHEDLKKIPSHTLQTIFEAKAKSTVSSCEDSKSIKDRSKVGKESKVSQKGTVVSGNPSYTKMKSKDDFLKEEIVNSIIDELLCRIEDADSIGGGSHFCLKHSSSQFFPRGASGIITHGLCHGLSLASCCNLKRDFKMAKLYEGEKRPRQMPAIIEALEIPINPPQSKHMCQHPRFERLTLDTLLTTSSTIIRTHSKLSARSRSRLSSGEVGDSNTSYTTTDETEVISSPFELSWCYGFNTEVPVINLTNDDCSQILFANSQYAVIYDFHEESMSFLQGHSNPVSCMAVNPSGSLLVTADVCSDVGASRVIVWDRRPCVLQVLDDVHPHGCQKVGLSVDGEFLVTVSANEDPATIKIWDWKRDSKNPLVSATMNDALGDVIQLSIDPNSNDKFALTYERSVVFAHLIWNSIFLEPPYEGSVREIITDCEFNTSTPIPRKLGHLTDSTFLEHDGAVALSATSRGFVVVWGDKVNTTNKRLFKKYVRLHLNCITNIQLVDDKIALATGSGNVSFYDFDLKILFSHKIHHEGLVSLSFNTKPQTYEMNRCNRHTTPSCANMWKNDLRILMDMSLSSEPVLIRHYIVSTESGKIAYINASSGTPKYLPLPCKETYTALDMMPDGDYLCAGTASGKCVLIDTESRKVKVIRQLKVQPNQCTAVAVLRYSNSREYLVCGMYTGEIWFLEPLILKPVMDSPLNDCSCCITQMKFSSNSEYLVVADVSHCITAYFLGDSPILIGQYIAHYKPIVTLLIVPTDNDKEINVYTVFSVSTDRSICQFIINRERKSFTFVVHQRVEQTAIPQYVTVYPTSYSTSGAYLGISDTYKFRLYDNPDAHIPRLTKKTRGTIQAPDFGCPINYMKIFYRDSEPYLFFKTDHHIGIHLLPIDGNPFKALGYRISPTDIICCAIDTTGQYVFTISESTSGISMWKINTKAVKDFHKSGGEGLEPFLSMLEEGKEEEIRDFFSLGQILHQGEGANLCRTLKNSIPVCEIGSILQALGCLLTKQAIHELTHDIVTSDPSNPTYYFSFDDFVRLYLNYRRTHDLRVDDLREAFQIFCSEMYSEPWNMTSDLEPTCDSELFIKRLLATGEEMTAEELYTDFSILTGGSIVRPDNNPYDKHFRFKIPPSMPKKFSFKTFVKDILGFNIDDSVFKD